jgi:hypothetical protein
VTDLDARQIPSFGRFCEHWDWAGQCYYQRFQIDNLGHYIGDSVSTASGYLAGQFCDRLLTTLPVERPHLQR